MIKKVLVLLAMLTLIVIPTTAFAQSEGTAAIRFVHVLSGAPGVDVYLDGALSYANLQFGQASPYLTVAPGTRSVTVTAAGDSSTTLWTQSVDITAGQALIAVVSSNNPLQFTVFQDDLHALPVGRSRLTAIHAIPDAPALDVMLQDGRPVIPNLQYNTPYGTLDIPSQAYDMMIVPSGSTGTSALMPGERFALASGTSYIVLAYGTLADPHTMLLSAPTLPNDANVGYVRFVHAALGVDPVDVRANDALVVPNLAFGTATEYIAMEAGDYHLSVSPIGGTSELVASDVTVAAGSRSSVVVWVTPAAAVMSTFSSDTGVILASQAQLTVSNVAMTGTAAASFSSGEAIVPSVSSNDAASTTVQTSSQDIVVSAGNQQAMFGIGGVYGGLYYDAVIYSGAPSTQVLTLPVVSLPLTTAPVAPSVAALPPTATPTPEVAVAVVNPVEPTQAAPQTNSQPAAVPTQSGPTARVVLNEGANLHLRRYPSADAESLGLAPTGTVLRVLGREGAPEPPSFFTPTPTPVGAPPPTPFIDPASLLAEGEDLDPRETWVFVEYDTPDGGLITAWVNALYLDVRDARNRIVHLRDLPTVPSNRAGQQGGQAAGVAPTQNPFHNQNVATVQGLETGANLHLRRTPNAQSESLALIPAGTAMIVTGRTAEGDWVQVEYQGQTGWVSTPYITLSYNDRAVDIQEIDVIATATPTPGAG